MHDPCQCGKTTREAQAKHDPGGCGAPLPCGHKTGGRNLIVCVDGTANQFGDKNTNVIELYRMILKDISDNQHTWYNSGIGTYAQPHWKSLAHCVQVLFHWVDMAIAWNFEKTVQSAYEWLSDTYEKGDCIFLFGFSRGAFQVRVLAAMIDKVGLIHKGNKAQIPFAYELYADPSTGEGGSGPLVDAPGSTIQGPKSLICKAARFKAAFSRDVPVHFVGVWDTVSSIGFARGKKTLPGTTDGMKHVCYFRQALALDERRVKFQPEYAYGGSAMPPPGTDAERSHAPQSRDGPTIIFSASNSAKPHTLEMWFAGTHSDIGGGNDYNEEMNRGTPPLRWMVQEAAGLGLRTEGIVQNLNPGEKVNFVESLTGIWRIFEFYPFERLTFSRRPEARGQTTQKPHFGSGRKIHEGQKIHGSIIFGEATYTPKESLATLSWSDLLETSFGNRLGILEADTYDYTRTTLKAYIAKPTEDTYQFLEQIAEQGIGAQVLYNEIIRVIQGWRTEETPNLENQRRWLDTAVRLLGPKTTALTLRDAYHIRPCLSRLLDGNDRSMVVAATTFFRRFTNLCTLELNGHTGLVCSVAFSLGGTRIVSGSDDRSIRIWDAQTGGVLKKLDGHTASVNSVGCSSDGTLIVSGSDDHSIRIWSVQQGNMLRKLEGHTGSVRSVTSSSTRITSGSNDHSIRIWDAQTGDMARKLEGHGVDSVGFPSDGTRIVSGSFYKSIRIWAARTGDMLWELERHTDAVRSVAFSPDGTRIVSGSDDHSIRIWDARTGDMLRKLEGHTGCVNSVGFSSDGTRIVSGSDDRSIRVWDVQGLL